MPINHEVVAVELRVLHDQRSAILSVHYCVQCTVTAIPREDRWVCPNRDSSGTEESTPPVDLAPEDHALSEALTGVRCGLAIQFSSLGVTASAYCNDLLGHGGPHGVIVGAIVNSDGRTVRGLRDGDAIYGGLKHFGRPDKGEE